MYEVIQFTYEKGNFTFSKHYLFRKMFASGGGGATVMFPKTKVPKIFRNTNFRPESPRKSIIHQQILNFTNFAIPTCQGPLPASWAPMCSGPESGLLNFDTNFLIEGLS